MVNGKQNLHYFLAHTPLMACPPQCNSALEIEAFTWNWPVGLLDDTPTEDLVFLGC